MPLAISEEPPATSNLLPGSEVGGIPNKPCKYSRSCGLGRNVPWLMAWSGSSTNSTRRFSECPGSMGFCYNWNVDPDSFDWNVLRCQFFCVLMQNVGKEWSLTAPHEIESWNHSHSPTCQITTLTLYGLYIRNTHSNRTSSKRHCHCNQKLSIIRTPPQNINSDIPNSRSVCWQQKSLGNSSEPPGTLLPQILLGICPWTFLL